LPFVITEFPLGEHQALLILSIRYRWMPHNASFGFLDRPAATPVLGSPAHGSPSLAMDQIEIEIF
jgi:hypothetical protein